MKLRAFGKFRCEFIEKLIQSILMCMNALTLYITNAATDCPNWMVFSHFSLQFFLVCGRFEHALIGLQIGHFKVPPLNGELIWGKPPKNTFFSSMSCYVRNSSISLSVSACVRACVCFVYVFWHNTVWSPQIQMIKNFDNSYSTEQSSNACV